jgi:hypothetical protein
MLTGSAIALATERAAAPVQGMHRAIARRWFAAIGSPARPAERVHDAVANAAYASVRFGGVAIGLAVDTWVDDHSPGAEAAQSLVNGLWGDALGERSHPLSVPMSVRDRDGATVRIDAGLGRAFPDATGRLVVLVHGLIETERSWIGTAADPGLLQALDDHPLLTSVPIRYNTGLRISDNGRLLADLLEDLRAQWPVPVESISLVGHSMGGLVIRSACLTAAAQDHRWIDCVDDVATLGTPHRGAPLEKFVNAASWALDAASETRPLAEFLNSRSGGVKDLRFGAVAEHDWRGLEPDALLRNTVGDHALPSGIRHHFVVGTATADPTHPVGSLVGDLVVRPSSSSGRRTLTPTSVAMVGGVRHLDLPCDPEVIDRVMRWLAPRASDQRISADSNAAATCSPHSRARLSSPSVIGPVAPSTRKSSPGRSTR